MTAAREIRGETRLVEPTTSPADGIDFGEISAREHITAAYLPDRGRLWRAKEDRLAGRWPRRMIAALSLALFGVVIAASACGWP